MEKIGWVDRRQLMLGSAALGAAGMLPQITMAQTPKRGGNFRIGVADFATQDSLNPTTNNTRFQLYMEMQLRNALVEVGPNGELIPELAESWEGSKDAKTWSFKIRKGVTFHNGKSLTPEDVVFSFKLHMGKDTKSSGKPFLAGVTDVKVDGPERVAFTLTDGNVSFPANTSFHAFMIVPDGTTDFEKGVGTGGYVLEEWKPGIRSKATRNPNYWKAGRAHFDSIEMFGMKDAAARSNALVSGQIDAFNLADPETVRLLGRNKNVQILQTKSKAHIAFPMMVDTEPFNDPNVRKALKYAIDREDMVKRILRGAGSVGTDQPINSAYEYFDASIKPYRYDPERAKSLLKRAGKSDLALQLYVSDSPFAGATDAAVLFKEHAAKAGIKIDVVKVPADGYWSNTWNKKPFCASRWSGRISEDAMFTLAYTDQGMKVGWNETHYHNEKLESLVLQARSEFNPGKRRELYAECQHIVQDDGGALVFAFADFVDAASAKVRHPSKLGGEFDLDGGRAVERWWFA